MRGDWQRDSMFCTVILRYRQFQRLPNKTILLLSCRGNRQLGWHLQRWEICYIASYVSFGWRWLFFLQLIWRGKVWHIIPHLRPFIKWWSACAHPLGQKQSSSSSCSDKWPQPTRWLSKVCIHVEYCLWQYVTQQCLEWLMSLRRLASCSISPWWLRRTTVCILYSIVCEQGSYIVFDLSKPSGVPSFFFFCCCFGWGELGSVRSCRRRQGHVGFCAPWGQLFCGVQGLSSVL